MKQVVENCNTHSHLHTTSALHLFKIESDALILYSIVVISILSAKLYTICRYQAEHTKMHVHTVGEKSEIELQIQF